MTKQHKDNFQRVLSFSVKALGFAVNSIILMCNLRARKGVWYSGTGRHPFSTDTV